MNLTDNEALGISLSARNELIRRSYEYFFQYANPEAKLYPHVKVICDALQKIIDGEQHFYIVEMPPQHGKSLSITKTFGAYYLLTHPEARVMETAYAFGLSGQFATDNRRKYIKWAHVFGLDIGKNTANEFTVKDHRGSFVATSMLGGASGMSADLLIIDDPVKNSEEASSQTIKDKIWNEWNLTFYPRLQKGGSVIVIMTRWQQDDLAGRLLKKMSLPWEEIKLPAIAELAPGEVDIIGRHNGEALCPELHSLKELKIHKHDMGTQKFTALYQQSPTIQGGNIFKREWTKFYVPDKETMYKLGLTEKEVKILPRHLDGWCQSWDATFKSGENDDFVAGQVWTRKDADYFFMPNSVHERLSFTETLDKIRYLTRLYPQARSKYIEDKANGSAIIDTLKSEIGGIIPIEPDGGKIVRASAVSPLWESGNVYVPHPLWKPEIEDWLEEVYSFPNAPHDDRVDAMTQALNNMKIRKYHGPRFI